MGGEGVVVDGNAHAARVNSAEPLVDVGDISLVSLEGNNGEEVVSLLRRKAVGNDVGADCHKGSVSSLGG